MDAIVFDVLIEAIEETHVITLPVTALSPLAQQRPEIELFLYKTASERFSDIMWTMQQILFMGMDRRAAIFLWDESAQKSPVLRITHDEMAATSAAPGSGHQGTEILRPGGHCRTAPGDHHHSGPGKAPASHGNGLCGRENASVHKNKPARGFPAQAYFMLWIFPKKKAQLPPPLSAQRGQQGDTAQTRPGSGNPPSAP